MVVAVVVVSIVAVGLLVGLVATRARLGRLGQELADSSAAAEQARIEADGAAEALAASTAEAAAAQARADEAAAAAQAALTEAGAEVEAAETARDEAAARADEARAAADALAAAGGTLDGATADGLWVLEARRVERRWRQIEAAGIERSPFDGRADPAWVATQVVLEASREEAGTAFELRWAVASPPSPARALALVRVVEELAAGLGPLVDSGVVTVADRPDGEAPTGAIELRLETDPPVPLPAELAVALAVLGAQVHAEPCEPGAEVDGAEEVDEGSRIVVRLGR
jgi:hypothetical protein